jgi:hypothetical protein
MAISRKKILEKIAGYRKAIDYHLDEHIPELLANADRERVEYWRKEVSSYLDAMLQWSGRLSNNETIVADAADRKKRLTELLDGRLQQLDG